MLALSQPTSLRGSPAASRRGGGLGGAGVSGGIGRQPGISQSYNTSPSGHRTLIDDYSGNCVNPYLQAWPLANDALSLVKVIRCEESITFKMKFHLFFQAGQEDPEMYLSPYLPVRSQ